MLRRFAMVALLLPALAGCGSPLLHGLDASGHAASDPGLAGTWITLDADAPTQVRATIVSENGADGGYRLALAVRHEGALRAELDVELTLVDVGGVRCADLFLARPVRDELVERYGFLVLPVHQVMRLDRAGDELRAAMLSEAWIRAHGDLAAHDRMTVGGGDVTVIAAPASDVARLLARHAADDGVFGEPIILRRTE